MAWLFFALMLQGTLSGFAQVVDGDNPPFGLSSVLASLGPCQARQFRIGR